MAWRAFLDTLRWRATSLADNLAEVVAELCREPIFRLVCGKAAWMSAAEARGYIAARCSMRVAIEGRFLLRERGLRLCWQEELTRRATAKLVQLVLDDIRNTSRERPPLRKAA